MIFVLVLGQSALKGPCVHICLSKVSSRMKPDGPLSHVTVQARTLCPQPLIPAVAHVQGSRFGVQVSGSI